MAVLVRHLIPSVIDRPHPVLGHGLSQRLVVGGAPSVHVHLARVPPLSTRGTLPLGRALSRDGRHKARTATVCPLWGDGGGCRWHRSGRLPDIPFLISTALGLCARVGGARAAPRFRRRRGRHHRGEIGTTNDVRDGSKAGVRGGPGTGPIAPPAVAPERRRLAGYATRARSPAATGNAERRLRRTGLLISTALGAVPAPGRILCEYEGVEHIHASPAMQRVVADDAVGQLCDRRGRMAELATENGHVMLDWVDGVERLLSSPGAPERVEAEARALLDAGITHIIWAGMGGSVMAVRVLVDLLPWEGVTLLPLDSTDPAALDAVIATLAAAEGVPLERAGEPDTLRRLLARSAMVAVAMGRTSEEPITHLAWYVELLETAGLEAADHTRVMAIPNSYLEQFAHEHGLPLLGIQPDGRSGTGGRMSAPATRVFLLPAALWLCSRPGSPRLRAVLREAWDAYDLDGARRHPDRNPFVRLAAMVSDLSLDGALLLTLELPAAWPAFFPWVEQLLEESLGKGGQGIVLFEPQHATPGGDLPLAHAVFSAGGESRPDFAVVVAEPFLSDEPDLVGIARLCLGWQLCMAGFGWLHEIQFAGQPAVEDYKARARALREAGDPIASTEGWLPEWTAGDIRVLLPPDAHPDDGDLGERLRREIAEASYLGLTVNGELSADDAEALRRLGFEGPDTASRPVKVRRAPAAYHSTEQSEMDGPPGVLSLRFVRPERRCAAVGEYDTTFLHAQAVGTWRAMIDAGVGAR